ncbi:hypothetical protein MFIFM68171_09872 [Madurella fahalii]|uniref:Ankyrin n=1 Tax=Madurella fahalii TaxID=1157608 RepID=A0ABQ0GPJ5_9PEZI
MRRYSNPELRLEGQRWPETSLWAAGGGHEAVVKMLLDTGRVDVDSTGDSGWAPLSWAAVNGHEAMVQMLLDTGNPDDDNAYDTAVLADICLQVACEIEVLVLQYNTWVFTEDKIDEKLMSL